MADWVELLEAYEAVDSDKTAFPRIKNFVYVVTEFYDNVHWDEQKDSGWPESA